MYRLILPTGT